MDAKFTKDPWVIVESGGNHENEITTQKRMSNGVISICGIDTLFNGEIGAEQEANLHLIAAAPDMYQMIDGLIRELNATINECNYHRSLVINSQTENEPDYIDAQTCYEAQLLLKKARGE